MVQIPSQQLPANPKADGMNWKVLITGIVIGVMIVLIAVIGTVLYKNAVKEEPVQKVSTSTQKTATPSAKTSTESAQKSETTDWKTYTNSQLGFSLKQPDEFPFIEERLSISGGQIPSVVFSNNKDFSSTDTKITTFSVSKGNLKAAYDAIDALELNKTYSRAVAEAPDIAEETRLANVIIDGQVGIKQSYLPSTKGVGQFNYTLNIYIKKGSEYYKISMISGKKENYEKNTKTFDSMVSTFEFLE